MTTFALKSNPNFQGAPALDSLELWPEAPPPLPKYPSSLSSYADGLGVIIPLSLSMLMLGRVPSPSPLPPIEPSNDGNLGGRPVVTGWLGSGGKDVGGAELKWLEWEL